MHYPGFPMTWLGVHVGTLKQTQFYSPAVLEGGGEKEVQV